jgi:hypothetical protein
MKNALVSDWSYISVPGQIAHEYIADYGIALLSIIAAELSL